jgi:hypothetical protein
VRVGEGRRGSAGSVGVDEVDAGAFVETVAEVPGPLQGGVVGRNRRPEPAVGAGTPLPGRIPEPLILAALAEITESRLNPCWTMTARLTPIATPDGRQISVSDAAIPDSKGKYLATVESRTIYPTTGSSYNAQFVSRYAPKGASVVAARHPGRSEGRARVLVRRKPRHECQR